MKEDVEIWADIPRFEGLYQVSSAGRVRSLDRWVPCGHGGHRRMKGRVLKTRRHPFGYPMVVMSGNGRRADRTVHSLVAEAFLGPRPDFMHVCHKDGNPANCSAWNLRYGNAVSNNGDKVFHGTQPSGEENYNSILKAEDVVKIRERRASGEKLGSIANDYGLEPLYVWQITTGKKWKKVGGPITKKSKTPKKLTVDEIKEASALRSEGMTLSAIAIHFGVSKNQVWTATK